MNVLKVEFKSALLNLAFEAGLKEGMEMPFSAENGVLPIDQLESKKEVEKFLFSEEALLHVSNLHTLLFQLEESLPERERRAYWLGFVYGKDLAQGNYMFQVKSPSEDDHYQEWGTEEKKLITLYMEADQGFLDLPLMTFTAVSF